MSGLRGNPHEENFRRTRDWLADHHNHPDTTVQELSTLTADMIAFSNMAVAYEQRTANLLAAIDGTNPRVTLKLTEEDWETIGAELRERLGLGPASPDYPRRSHSD